MPTLHALEDSASGVLTTVNDWLKDPLVIPQAVYQLTERQLAAEALLRNGGRTTSGVVKYYEAQPQYMLDGLRVREEFDEPHIMRSEMGQAKSVSTEEVAGSILVSEEMRRRMVLDPMLTQIRKAVRTYRRECDRQVFRTLFTHPGVQTYTVANAWSSNDATARFDILEAKRLIKTAHPDGMDADSRFGFDPDTLMIGEDAEASLIMSVPFNELYHGNLASEDLRYTGKLPNKIYGLDVLVNPFLPAGKALLLERNTAGAWVDEVPFVVEPTHPWEDHYAWRTNMRRSWACFLDAPQAVCVINGV